jgi:diguanylate cyclase
MSNVSVKPLSSFEIVRVALRRMADQKLPPTPENYAREYRLAAGLPLLPAEQPETWDGGAETIEMVRGIVHVVGEATAGLASGLERFDLDSSRILATVDEIRDPSQLERLLRAIIALGMSLKEVVDLSKKELNETRHQLQLVSAELEKSEALARTDPLTGFCNRRGMNEIVAREIARARRSREPFSIGIIDIDHFKKINDQYGHAIGDAALIHLAAIAKAGLRETDAICRFGGEEFVLVLPCAGAQGAHFVVDRLRRMTENTPLVLENQKVTMRFSAGVAELIPNESADALVQRADAALYQAKRAGRNRVEIAAEAIAA